MNNHRDTYSYDESGKILIRDYSGIITAQKLMASWEYILKNNLLNSTHKGTITNYSNASGFNLSHQDVIDARPFFAQNHDLFSKIKQAQVVTTPEIAFAVILNKQFPQYQMREFGALQHAIKWILSA